MENTMLKEANEDLLNENLALKDKQQDHDKIVLRYEIRIKQINIAN